MKTIDGLEIDVTPQVDFIIPSFQSETLTSLAIKSFERYKNDFKFRYIVVENAADESYKDNILSLADDVVWVSNKQRAVRDSVANAEAIEIGLQHVQTDLVFICHNDVVACHDNWMNFLYEKIQEGSSIAGTVMDNSRINAVHISGMLLTTELAKRVSCYPISAGHHMLLDVGDAYTKYCRENNLKYFCCNNTHNMPNRGAEFDAIGPFSDFSVDRALDAEGNIIYMHLGRGTMKAAGKYWKSGKIGLAGWEIFVNKNVLMTLQV